ncbi:Tip attachment protein J, partial [uncultured Caudovirales phage]
MLANVIYCNNPLDPINNREVVTLTRKRRIDKLAPKITTPFIAVLNGQPLLRKDEGWKRSIKNGDILVFVAIPQGGGGGSNPLKLALMVALSFAAPGIGAAIADSMGIAGAGFMASTTVFGSVTVGSLFGAAVSFLGTSLLNAIMPASTPSAYNNGSYNTASPSPTYNINAQGNAARLMQAIPAIYGRHLIYPDYAAEPYSEYSGNEQYLYQLFSIGLGYYDIEKINIEDTDISNFDEVQYEVIQPGSSVTLFPTNVITASEVSGQEIQDMKSGTYSVGGLVVTVTATAHGVGVGNKIFANFANNDAYDGIYTVTATPTADTLKFSLLSVPAVTSGNITVSPFVGAYSINAATTSISKVAVDVVLPQGLFYANDAGGLDARTVSWRVVVRKIDDSGVAIGGYQTLGSETFTAATNTPQRLTYRYDVAPGRYEIMLARTSIKDTSARAGNSLNWGSARGYIQGTETYPATMLAVRIRATNNISNTSARRFNVIVTRKLPIYRNGKWTTTPEATRSIAWAVADMLRASYGGMSSDARIDLRKLTYLENTWSARGDKFDAVFDSKMTVWEAISAALRVGRTRPFFQGGIVRFVRDEPVTLPTAMFNMRNITKGSLKTQYLMNDTDTADSVIVEYFDSTTWKPAEVTATLPGSTNVNPARVKLFGCTDKTRAWKEGMYMAASNRYRRQMITFTTEMEGFIPALGDLIAISHDRPNWGQSGELLSEVTGTNLLPYSEQLERVTPWVQVAMNVAANAKAAPDGKTTAARLVPTAVAGPHYLDYQVSTLSDNTIVSASIYVAQHVLPKVSFSFIAKDGLETWIELYFKDSTVTSSNIAVGQTTAKLTVDVLPSGWYRLNIAGLSAKSGATIPRFRVYSGINAGLAFAHWTKSDTTSVFNSISIPIGSIPTDLWSADSLIDTATTARHYATTSLNLIANKKVVIEQYFRPIVTGQPRYVSVVLTTGGGAFTANQAVTIDLNNGSVPYTTGTAITAISVSDILDLGNGWFKVILEVVPTGTGTAEYQITLSNVSNNP